ncbi:asparagine synthetase B (glutamine-hydrolyzing) [Brevibacterium epidermidis]|uniref:Asparagine synthetase B (Glutamine-hydrolyzing) n=1 Tax=Brevibacterium epidermidis TaxID=1698 RepID=A0ABV4EJ33_BREEP
MGWDWLPERFQHLSFGELSVWFDSERTPAIARSESAAVLLVGTAAFVPPGPDQAEATADLQAIAEILHTALVESQEHFLDALDYLGGRFAIIVEVDGLYRVFHDAHGTSTIYYDANRQAFSTHAYLLASLVGAEPRRSDELKAAQSWAALPLSFAWDETPYPTIRALLPNHVLELESRRTYRYFPRERNRFTGLTFEERASEINRLWLGQMSAFAQTTDRFFVSLSGGLDSRVVLAALRGYKDKVDAFTYFTNN